MTNNGFVISLDGLNSGKRVLEGSFDGQFFKEFGNADILAAEIKVVASIEKSGSFIGVDCDMTGSVTVSCDRCLSDLLLPIDTRALLSVKFADQEVVSMCENEENGREVIVLPKDMAELDLSQVVYDYVCTDIPMIRCHKDGSCDPEVISRMATDTPEESLDNPFAALGGLFEKK